MKVNIFPRDFPNKSLPSIPLDDFCFFLQLRGRNALLTLVLPTAVFV